jgi:predicted transposase/invertase (TIGR01784 family)
MIKIWEYNIKQKEAFVPVIPIVLYHGKENWKPGRLKSCFKNLPEEIAPFIPDFKYIFVDLSHYTDEEIADRIFTQASLKISLLILKNIFHTEKLEKELRNFFEIGRIYFQEEKGLKFLESIIKYVFQVTEIKTLRVVEAIKPVTPKGGDLAMTTAEKLRQEGKQEGRQEGRQEGSYNTLYSVIQTMRKNGIADENIAKMMNLDIYIVKKVLNREEVEIPLNLLRRESGGEFGTSYK